MKILYVSYWGVNDGLSASTVLPHLKILGEFPEVESIVYCSIERNDGDVTPVQIPKVMHVPLRSKTLGNVFATKINDFVKFPMAVARLCAQHKVDLMICRSPMAGAIGYLATWRWKVPFVVESFEPHGISMVESGVWSFADPRYWIEAFFENRQKQRAKAIVTVSNHYREKLIDEGLTPENVFCVPCCVSLADFSFNASKREKIRLELQIAAATRVGIYVGKFGGIYYEKESFDLYRQAFNYFTDFHLIILTADDHETVAQGLRSRNIDLSKVTIRKAPHLEVGHYLSASDFAFCTIKPVPSRLYCSPIKNGEYWANGLPVLVENGIGDDSEIISNEGGGVIIDMSSPYHAFSRLEDMLKLGRVPLTIEISGLAKRHRSMDLVKASYREIFGVMNKMQ